MITLAKWLFDRMLEANLTQADLARLSGISRPRVSEIIRGEPPTMAEMRALVAEPGLGGVVVETADHLAGRSIDYQVQFVKALIELVLTNAHTEDDGAAEVALLRDALVQVVNETAAPLVKG